MDHLDVSSGHVGECREFEVAAISSWLAHEAQVDVDPTLVLDKWLIAGMVFIDPVTYISSQLCVVGLCAVKLVRERAEEAVAVAEGICSVEPQLPELIGELLCVLCRIRQELQAWMPERSRRRKHMFCMRFREMSTARGVCTRLTLPLLDLSVRVRTTQ